MAQTNFSQTSRKITIMNNKLDQRNFNNRAGPTKAEKMKSIDFNGKNKFQRPFIHQRSTKNLERKYLSPKINNVPSSSNADSFNEEENIKNVERWLETLPNNQDWCKIEEDPLDRQGDFGKEKSQTLNTFDLTQPSTSYQNNSSQSINNLEKYVSSNNKEATFKNTAENLTFEIQNSKLSNEQKSGLKMNSDRLGKIKNFSTSLRVDNRKSIPGYKNREENAKTRRHSYNLRNLESRKIDVIDQQEKINRTRRNCSIRCQETRRRSREIPSTRTPEQNEYRQVENLNPRKLKSPFTKQARSTTPSLLSDLPHLSSFNLNELKEMEKNDKVSEKQNDRKIITRLKLENNKKLLNSVKVIINNMDTNENSIHKSTGKYSTIVNEKIENLISPKNSEELKRKINNPHKTKPAFENSKLEEKLNSEMEITVNKYKRSYGNRKNLWFSKVKDNIDQVEEPPEKKKKLYCK